MKAKVSVATASVSMRNHNTAARSTKALQVKTGVKAGQRRGH
jgi:hypothetical protein